MKALPAEGHRSSTDSPFLYAEIPPLDIKTRRVTACTCWWVSPPLELPLTNNQALKQAPVMRLQTQSPSPLSSVSCSQSLRDLHKN